MAKQSETVLRVEGPIAKQLAIALRKPKPVAAIVALLAKHIDPKHPPTWLAFNPGKFLDTIVRLESPAFYATGADEDEFWSEPPRPQIVFGAGGRCQRVTRSGETSEVSLGANKVGAVTAFDLGGFLLQDITWLGKAPPTFAAAKKLFEAAGDAYQGDLAHYELPSPAQAPTSTGTDVRGDAYLGSAMRTGCYAAQASRNQPKVKWQLGLSSQSDGSERGCNPVVAGALVIAGDDAYSAMVSATKIGGTSAWTTKLTKNQSWPTGNAHCADGVVYQPTNQALFAIDAKTGKPKWGSRQRAILGTPLVIGNRVYIGTCDGVLGLALATGRKQWSFAVKKNEYKQGVTGGLAYADGTLYFFADRKLFALDLATGKKRWTAPVHSGAVPALDATTVYAFGDTAVSAFDRATGKLRWAVKSADYSADKTIAVGSDRVVVRLNAKLVALAKKTGKKLWSFGPQKEPSDIGNGSPIIAGDVAVCSLVDDSTTTLYAVDLKTGTQLWAQGSFGTGPGAARVSWYCTPAVLPDGTVLVQAYGLKALR